MIRTDLNRSQPPLFIQMLDRYVTVTNDTSILKRALPLAEKELKWWNDNRMINVTSPFTNTTHKLARYAVNNTAPRPESYFAGTGYFRFNIIIFQLFRRVLNRYLADYDTANNEKVQPALNLTQRSDLYAELASGAESGWDYTTRWLDNGSGDLKTLHLRSLIAVDLNSILCTRSSMFDRISHIDKHAHRPQPCHPRQIVR
jgi:alpha,alpha-trehalase